MAVDPSRLPCDAKTRLLQVLWPIFGFCLYAFVSFWYFPWSILHGAVYLGVISNPVPLLAYALMLYWFVAWAFTTLSASVIDFIAEYVFPEVPYYNGNSRPKHGFWDRVKFHFEHLFHTLMLAVLQFFFRIDMIFPWLFKQVGLIKDQAPITAAELHYKSVAANTNVTATSTVEDPIVGVWLGELPLDLNSYLEIISPGSESLIVNFFVIFALVQVVLVLADVTYGSWHFVQHKYKFLYRMTNHGYHHQFHYPIGAAGSWLSWLDICLSATFSHLLPTGLTIAIFQSFGFFNLSEFALFGWKFLMQLYIHEMNHFDHCGKQVPVWSGCPLCPPLGFALGLHESIPCHESHHNFGNVGFGLLGVVDKVLGTAQYPVDHPKHIKDSSKKAQ